MKTSGIVLISVFIVIILVALYQYNKKNKIKNAAMSSGIPTPIASAIANSSNPSAAARVIGVPATIADSIANGVAVNLS